MAALDPRIEVIREAFGLSRTDFWEIPQKPGTWVAKHAALEIAAVKAGIVFSMPTIIEHDAPGLVASIVVQGTMGERTEWSIGETNPTNYRVSGKQPSYPWAMAEKRAKDRVILKLIGIHGLVYSEDEMSGSTVEAPAPAPAAPAAPAAKSSAQAKREDLWPQLIAEVDACPNLEELERLLHSKPWQDTVKPLPKKWIDELRDYVQEAREAFAPVTAVAAVAPNFDHMDRAQ